MCGVVCRVVDIRTCTPNIYITHAKHHITAHTNRTAPNIIHNNNMCLAGCVSVCATWSAFSTVSPFFCSLHAVVVLFWSWFDEKCKFMPLGFTCTLSRQPSQPSHPIPSPLPHIIRFHMNACLFICNANISGPTFRLLSIFEWIFISRLILALTHTHTRTVWNFQNIISSFISHFAVDLVVCKMVLISRCHGRCVSHNR